jgi:hypothetical protein
MKTGENLDDTIFVAIPCYRDNVACARTLYDMFANAACPSRIFVGACIQQLDGDVDVLTRYKHFCKRNSGVDDYSENIRIFTMNARDGAGPCLARSIIESSLFRHEKFYMNICSHCAFVRDWDLKIVRNWRLCPSPNAIITCMPKNFGEVDRTQINAQHPNKTIPPTFMIFSSFRNHSGMPLLSSMSCRDVTQTPCPSLFWTSLFSFCESKWVQCVPTDPFLDFMEEEEYFTMGARLYTHGCDMFSPTETIVLHQETHHSSRFLEFCLGNSASEVEKRDMAKKAVERLQAQLGMTRNGLVVPLEGDNSTYSFGSVRTIQQYFDYCGVDPVSRTVRPRSLLGVVRQPSHDCVLSRYTSMSEFYFRLRRVAEEH